MHIAWMLLFAALATVAALIVSKYIPSLFGTQYAV